MEAHLRVDSGRGDHIFESMIAFIDSVKESSLVPAHDHKVEAMLLQKGLKPMPANQ